MKLVVQRVEKARVTRVSGQKTVGEIGLGLFVLVGFKKGDSEKDVETLASKLLKLRVMSDDQDKMNLAVKDLPAGRQGVGGSFLLVSQFTLYADTSAGNRPSFINAEDPTKAEKLYNLFVEKIRASGIKTETGSFGDYMKIEAVLDGPVTIIYSD